jgi:hypothetical protein
MKRVAEVAHANKNAELDSLVNAQAQKIVELEIAYANLKLEKENLTAGHWTLSEKHKALIERIDCGGPCDGAGCGQGGVG